MLIQCCAVFHAAQCAREFLLVLERPLVAWLLLFVYLLFGWQMSLVEEGCVACFEFEQMKHCRLWVSGEPSLGVFLFFNIQQAQNHIQLTRGWGLMQSGLLQAWGCSLFMTENPSYAVDFEIRGCRLFYADLARRQRNLGACSCL